MFERRSTPITVLYVALGSALVCTIVAMVLLWSSLNTAHAVGGTVLLSDDFDRPDNAVVGEGWVELEQAGPAAAAVSIAGNKLFFEDASDAARRPAVSRSFYPVSTGTLWWEFDFDWGRVTPDPGYELWMQLGDGSLMEEPTSNPTQFTGVGVNLRWGGFSDGDQRLVARQDAASGGAVALTTISGPTHVLVTADVAARTYSVTVDGVVVGSGLGFDNLGTVATLDTVRFFANNLDEQNFAGRTFDNLIISTGEEGNNAPAADAGPDQSVLVGTTVVLDASGSADADGDLLTYSWSLTTIPAASTAALTGAETANPSFVADLAGTYQAELVVNDGTVDGAADTVTISASDPGENTAPVAAAGDNQAVNTGSTVTLDGTASTDADGDPLSYSWTLTGMPAASTAALTGAETANPSFVADLAGTYQAELVVNDGTVDSAPDTVSIEASDPRENTAPVAAAGDDQVVRAGDTVTLDATRSADPDGDPLTYSWTLTGMPTDSTASLTGAATASPSFVADLVGTYHAELLVNDGTVDSAPDTVSVAAVETITTLLNDNFDRPDSPEVGESWVEVEDAEATLAISNQKLFFAGTSDVADRPLARRSFPRATTGLLQFDFQFEWARTGDEDIYSFLMQLGDGALMSDDLRGRGTGVDLIWTRIGGVHQSLGYRQAGTNTPLAVMSGQTQLSVVADLDARTYSVAVDGQVVQSAIPFNADVSLDTVRFFTNNLEETNFAGRSIDNVVITRPAGQLLAAEPFMTMFQDPTDGATGLNFGIARVFDPGTGAEFPASLGSFQVRLTYLDETSDPTLPPGSRCINIPGVREMEIPISSPNINDIDGVSTFEGSTTEGVSAPADLGFVLMRLTGGAAERCRLSLEVTSLRDVDGNPIAVPAMLGQTFLRGDARADGVVDIADALFIAQNLVGSRDACTSVVNTACLHPINSASVRQDGPFDGQSLADSLFIAQYVLGMKDEFYNPVP